MFRDAVFPAASLNTFFGQLHAGCSAQNVQGRCLPNTVPEHLHCPNSKSVQGRRRIFSTLNSAWVAGNYLEPPFSGALHCRELLGTTSIWSFGTKLPFGARRVQTPPPPELLGTTFQSVQGRRSQAAYPEHSPCGGHSPKKKQKAIRKVELFRIPVANIHRKRFYRN